KTIHDEFVSAISAQLTPEQVETVKDGFSSGKVPFTYKGYTTAYPNLTDEQRAKDLDMLKEAREQAMVAGSSEEKTASFTKYKGRINNHLSKEGKAPAKAGKAKPTTKPAEEPAKTE